MRFFSYFLLLLPIVFLIGCSDDEQPAVPTPRILSVAPDSGLVGTVVTIYGQNFSEVTTENLVAFNGVQSQITALFDTTNGQLIKTTVPPNASTGPVTVLTNGLTSNGSNFSVLNSLQVIKVTPSIFTVNDTVDIEVSGIAFPPSRLVIGGNTAIVLLVDKTSSAPNVILRSVVPTEASSGNIFFENGTRVSNVISGTLGNFSFHRSASSSQYNSSGVTVFSFPSSVEFRDNGVLFTAVPGFESIAQTQTSGSTTYLASFIRGNSNGTFSTAEVNGLNGFAFSPTGDTLYAAEQFNYLVRRFDLINNTVTTLAGSGVSGFANGQGTAAQFGEIRHLATDAFGNVYVGDPQNRVVRKITPSGLVSTFAGIQGVMGSSNTTNPLTSTFGSPAGLDFGPDGSLFVCDVDNRCIRKIAANGTVTTLAGVVGQSGYRDGIGTEALFAFPFDLTVAPNGLVYVADRENHSVRVVYPTGFVRTVAGSGQTGSSLTTSGSTTRFNQPYGLEVRGNNEVFVADRNNSRVVRILLSN